MNQLPNQQKMKKIIAVLVVLAVLTAAFFAGSLSNKNEKTASLRTEILTAGETVQSDGIETEAVTEKPSAETQEEGTSEIPGQASETAENTEASETAESTGASEKQKTVSGSSEHASSSKSTEVRNGSDDKKASSESSKSDSSTGSSSAESKSAGSSSTGSKSTGSTGSSSAGSSAAESKSAGSTGSGSAGSSSAESKSAGSAGGSSTGSTSASSTGSNGTGSNSTGSTGNSSTGGKSTGSTGSKSESTAASETKTTTYSCTLSISCKTVLNNMDSLDESKKSIIPDSGVILSTVTCTFNEGDTVYDVLKRECRSRGISMEGSSSYVEGIGNLYEFDCGSGSGWMYSVNGSFPNVGAGSYTLSDGDSIKWLYTCSLGDDL